MFSAAEYLAVTNKPNLKGKHLKEVQENVSKDLSTFTGGSGETKGFASSKEVASQNAIADAATDIGLAASRRLKAYLSQKTE